MLRDEIKQYTQPDGLVSPDKNPTPDSTGNGILYLSLYHVLLFKRNECTVDDMREYQTAIAACQVKMIPGLFNRSKTKTQEQISRDDYYGIMVVSRLYNLYFAKDIYELGRSNRYRFFKYVFDNCDTGSFSFSAWLGRFLEFDCVAKVCAGQRVGIISSLKYSFGLFFTGLFSIKNSTNVMLAVLCDEVIRENETLPQILAWLFFEWRVKRYWGSFENVVGANFGKDDILKGMEHPIAKYWVSE